jgi:hypothetical protein
MGVLEVGTAQMGREAQVVVADGVDLFLYLLRHPDVVLVG